MPVVDIVTNFLKIGISSSSERIITLEEVSYHSGPKDYWIVLYDKVYDITKFLQIVSNEHNRSS
jgi:cytochrome b involved in lipid metabolism